VLGEAAVPLLVIVDYAETRTTQVAAALRECARHGCDTPLRMLLLARTAGDWWDGLQAADPHAEALLDSAPVVALAELEPEPGGPPRTGKRSPTWPGRWPHCPVTNIATGRPSPASSPRPPRQVLPDWTGRPQR
jgi:hypothetical protein